MDKDHPILGFFHRWVEEFAKHCEVVHVICLFEGKHSLPSNVHVHSLGKEKGRSRIKYLLRFYSLIWNLRKEYDNVFVHMNQIYVILGAPVWRILGKKIGLWYAHGTVNISLRMAERLTHIIFSCSKESFRVLSKKIIITGHGIDTELFRPKGTYRDIDLVTVGRISSTKNIHTLIEVLAEVRKKYDATLTIIGDVLTAEDKNYKERLQTQIKASHLELFVNFIGPVKHYELPMYLNRSKIFVHAATNGSLDKAVLEPMACEVPVVSMSEGMVSVPAENWHVANKDSFVAETIKVLQSSTSSRTFFLRDFIRKNHSLESLVPKILDPYIS